MSQVSRYRGIGLLTGPYGSAVYPSGVLTWSSEDTFEIGSTTFVCRPMEGRFASEPGRFCLLKPRHEVDWYERFLRDQAPRTIFEVGSYDGASSAFFAEIARPATLVTIDRRPTPSPALIDFIERRGFGAVMSAYCGVDQSDAPRLREILDETFGDTVLDLVVDDASHLVEPTRATFNCLFPRLAAGRRSAATGTSHAASQGGDGRQRDIMRRSSAHDSLIEPAAQAHRVARQRRDHRLGV